MGSDGTTHQEYLDGRYSERDHPWSGAGRVKSRSSAGRARLTEPGG
ncbi:hypothetical protein [Actinomadura madurae]|nr:hypothetical protein [Actinomadura madurae]MCP9976957.1 hypothetical protein [Actinomadura madurae]